VSTVVNRSATHRGVCRHLGGDPATSAGVGWRRQTSLVMVTTDRLVLVPVGPGHVDDLVVLHSGPDVAFWYAGTWMRTEALDWARQMSQRWRDEGVGKWIAYRRSDGELVGRGGLTWTTIDDISCLEVGWLVREKHRGVGYATEIGSAGLDFAFGELDAAEVVAFTEVHNRASRAVMTRLGMTMSGLIYRPGLVEGRPGVQPSAPFALYRSQRPGAQSAHSNQGS
jgi:RimJ/RimL family protein N-acetyltransferase